jgi:hypothetical protein
MFGAFSRSEIEHEYSIESSELSEYKMTPNSESIRTFLYLLSISKIVRIKCWHFINQKHLKIISWIQQSLKEL